MLSFIWPWAFWFLPVPWLIYRIIPKAPKHDVALFVPFFDELHGFDRQSTVVRSRFLKVLLLILTWCLLIAALSRPQWIGDPVALPVSGRDLMVAVDISGSMGQEDMFIDMQQVSRIFLVKKVVNEFIERRTGDRIGLLLFGTEAYIQAPLTFDRQTVKTLFNEAQLGFAGKRTSIGDAIGLAVKRLKERPAENRVLILLTDGSNTAGAVEPLQAAKLAAQTGIVIYTIGVGAEEILVHDFFGARKVNPSADLDEELLREIADLTNGRYFRAHDIGELEQIYRIIDELEPVEQEAETFRPTKALFYWPLGAGLVLSFLSALLHIPLTILLKNFLRPEGNG
jgi:Ca-activated chloride channel family protein